MSRCPAAFPDFVWWSGLPIRQAQSALKLLEPNFTSEMIEGHTYWLSDSFANPQSDRELAYL
jgi:hypothetical protein